MKTRRAAAGEVLERVSGRAIEASGTSLAFVAALLMIVVWALTGPLFAFSDTWQLVINTATTIVTFLMVFLIQRAQNKDSQAIHLKLNEIVAAVDGASNRLIDAEGLSEAEIRALRDYYGKLIELAEQDSSLTATHSIEEATSRHGTKYRRRPHQKKEKQNTGKRELRTNQELHDHCVGREFG